MTNVQRIPIECMRGRDLSFSFATVSGTGIVWNTVGYVIRFIVKWREEDADGAAVISLTNGSGITASAGGVSVVVPASAFSSIPYTSQTLKYEMTLWDGTKSWSLASGDFIVRPNVVRTAN